MVYANKDLQAIVDSGHGVATSADVAKIFRISEQSVRRWACTETAPMGIKPIKIGNRLRWNLDDLNRILTNTESE